MAFLQQTDELLDPGYLAHKQHIFKKAWGQNFLRYRKDASSLLKNISLPEGSLVIEIGAGGGALTEALLKRHFQVLAFEIDLSLKDFLLNRFSEELQTGQLKLNFQDALQLDWQTCFQNKQSLAVISNLPYASTRELILKIFAEVGDKLQVLALMLQSEAIQRLLAAPPNETNYQAKLYGPQAVFSNLLFSKAQCLKIPAASFYPTPKVSNSFVVLTRNLDKYNNLRENLQINRLDADDFFTYFAEFLQLAFKQRRKQLVNTLAIYADDVFLISLLESLSLPITVRAEQVSPLMLLKLAIAMYNKENKKSD